VEVGRLIGTPACFAASRPTTLGPEERRGSLRCEEGHELRKCHAVVRTNQLSAGKSAKGAAPLLRKAASLKAILDRNDWERNN
jgi:hypothetical protein